MDRSTRYIYVFRLLDLRIVTLVPVRIVLILISCKTPVATASIAVLYYGGREEELFGFNA